MNRLEKLPVIRIVAGLTLIMVAAIWAAVPVAAQSTPAMKVLIEAAAKEGELNFLDSGGFSDGKFVRDIESGIKAKYGVTIRIGATGGPSMSQLVTRLVQEHQANRKPSTDLVRLSTRQCVRLLKTGVTEAVEWASYDPGIQPDEITSDGSGVVTYADRIGVVYNTKLIAPDMLPKSVEDLTSSEYKGKIGTTPYGTGWGEIALLYGSDHAMKLAKAFTPNVVGFTGSTQYDPVITGQMPIFAFTGSASKAIQEKEKGAPIDLMFPFQAYLLFSVNMLHGSQHPNAARLFALFLRTPEGQQILWEHRRQDSPFIDGSNESRVVKASRAAGQTVLLYREEDVVKHIAVFDELVPTINKMLRSK